MLRVACPKNSIAIFKVISICAWCHRVKFINPKYEVEWAAMQESLDSEKVSHTICPSCKEKMLGEMKEVI
ncbi:MAG: hypothetical protein GXO77_03985 [Calditrichaeota bacterium]|nr:hypothetical protein [Calditrichota bacterium]